MEEWKTARELLAKFDERIHDLGHWGMGFITALLAAESLLLPVSTGRTPGLEPPVKLVVIAVTLLLIVSVRLIQRNYELFQEATALRARAIERILGLELTEVISQVYRIDKSWRLVGRQYFFLTLGAGAVGYFAIQPAPLWPVRSESAGLVLLFTLIAAIYVMEMRIFVKQKAKVYWSTDRKTLPIGGSVRITFTNISHKRGR